MVKSAGDASLGVIAMVGVAAVMTTSGMTNLLARGLSQSISKTLYLLWRRLLACWSFLTGSNNNSNVLFGVLQMETARLLGLDVPLILAAQTAGGSLGSVMSPAKVIVGCSTVGLSQRRLGHAPLGAIGHDSCGDCGGCCAYLVFAWWSWRMNKGQRHPANTSFALAYCY